MGLGRATQQHAPRCHHRPQRRRSPPPGGDRRQPQRLSEACLAGRDRTAFGGRPRHRRDHASDGQVQDLRLALAGTLRRGRGRWAAARQDPSLAGGAARPGGHRPGRGPDHHRAAARGDPLDRSRHGRGGRHQRVLGAAHLEGARPGAAPRPPLQALERSRVRAQAQGHFGLYVDPPAHAVVLSVDEKSQSRRSTAPSPACP